MKLTIENFKEQTTLIAGNTESIAFKSYIFNHRYVVEWMFSDSRAVNVYGLCDKGNDSSYRYYCGTANTASELASIISGLPVNTAIA